MKTRYAKLLTETLLLYSASLPLFELYPQGDSFTRVERGDHLRQPDEGMRDADDVDEVDGLEEDSHQIGWHKWQHSQSDKGRAHGLADRKRH